MFVEELTKQATEQCSNGKWRTEPLCASDYAAGKADGSTTPTRMSDGHQEDGEGDLDLDRRVAGEGGADEPGDCGPGGEGPRTPQG